MFADVNESRRHLFYDNFRFVKNRIVGEVTHWKCSVYQSTNCRSRVSTRMINGYEMMKITNPHHNHEVNVKNKKSNKKTKQN